MHNLAGYHNSTEAFSNELRVIGARILPTDAPDGETGACVIGEIQLPAGFTLRIVRRWVYHSVTISPHIPETVVAELNQLPFHGTKGHYSGPSGTLGAVARATGYAGGMTTAEILKEHGVSHWHCDTIEATCALVKALEQAILRCRLDVVSAHRHYIRSYTEAWLRECGPAIGSPTGLIPKILRAALYTDTCLDSDHPLVRELRATYPQPAA